MKQVKVTIEFTHRESLHLDFKVSNKEVETTVQHIEYQAETRGVAVVNDTLIYFSNPDIVSVSVESEKDTE